MRNLFPILLITILSIGYYGCNRNTKADPVKNETTEAVNPEKEKMRKSAGMTATSGISAPKKDAALKNIQHNPVPQAPLSKQDSAKLYVTDDYVKIVEAGRGKTYPRKDIKLQLFSDNDNMWYTTEGQKVMEAVIISQKTDKDRERHYYYFKDNAYCFYRHLEMALSGTEPFVQETIVFFEGNKIFEVQQRRLDLKAGENPNKLLGKPFERPAVDKEAMYKEIEWVWGKLFEAIEDNEMAIN